MSRLIRAATFCLLFLSFWSVARGQVTADDLLDQIQQQPPSADSELTAGRNSDSDAGVSDDPDWNSIVTDSQYLAAENAGLEIDVVLVLDNSGSMKENDPQFLTSKAVTAFIERLSENSRIAIFIFDQNVDMAMPLTFISDASRQQVGKSLDKINYKGLFTDSPSAVERAIYELKISGRAEAEKFIVFMTDGIVDTGNAVADIERAKWLREDLAADAADENIRIFGIAFTEQADFQLIQSLAQKTDGEYFRVHAAEELPEIFERITSIITAPTIVNEVPPVVPEPETTIEEAPAGVPAPPVTITVPTKPVSAVHKGERIRSLIIITAAAVLIIGLLAIIFLLVKRGRDLRLASRPYAAEAYLSDFRGITSQSTYRLGSRPVMLGRVAGKDTEYLDYIVIPESTIGRRHALIEFKDFGYWISDQGSINGTFVNDVPVTSEVRIKHGDRIRLHKFEFEFVMPEMDSAGATVLSNTVFAEGSVVPAAEANGEAVHELEMTDEEKQALESGDLDLVFGEEPEEGGDKPDAVDSTEDETVIKDEGSVPADDETLLPAAGLEGAAVADTLDADDETLLPGNDEAEVKSDSDSEDETLMPADVDDQDDVHNEVPQDPDEDAEFFDITGAGRDPKE